MSHGAPPNFPSNVPPGHIPAPPGPGPRPVRKVGGLAKTINAFVGKPLLLLGLFLVILGRGCDAMGMRSVARTHAQYLQVMVEFKMEWDDKIAKNQQELAKVKKAIAAAKEENKTLNDQRDALQKEEGTLQTNMQSARTDKENGEWKPYREAQQSAVNQSRMWAYWYEMLFILGTLVLVLGVLALAFTGEGAERWVAYIMIAIITFSIYVAGAAWIESVITSTGSANPRGTAPGGMIEP